MPTYQNPQFWIYFLVFIYFYAFMRLVMPTNQNLQFWIYLFFAFVITHFTLRNFYLNNLVTHQEPEVYEFIYHYRNLKLLDLFIYLQIFLYISEDLNSSDFYQTRSSDFNCNFRITRSYNNVKA